MRHDLTRAIDQLRLPVEAGVRAIIARARDDLDVIACELAAAPAARRRQPFWRRPLAWLAGRR